MRHAAYPAVPTATGAKTGTMSDSALILLEADAIVGDYRLRDRGATQVLATTATR